MDSVSYANFSTAQLLGLIQAIAERRENSLLEVMYLLMLDYLCTHEAALREAVWDYLLKSADEIEEIVDNLQTQQEHSFDDLLASFGDFDEARRRFDIEDIKAATQRNLKTLLEG
jgi:xylose isomerase